MKSHFRIGIVIWGFMVGSALTASAQGLAGSAAAWALGTGQPLPGTVGHDIRPGRGVTAIAKLSGYGGSIAGTAVDSTVYILDSVRPGPTVFVAAGTHANEIAGIMAAVMMVERARPAAGRLLVLPHANNSGSGYREAPDAGPEWLVLPTPGGTRRFAIGSRLLSPLHQSEPDPESYLHSPGMEAQPGSEARNLDRAYPGDSGGSLTARLADAIMSLILREKVDVAFDLHEACPVSTLSWTVVANPKNLETAALALFDLDERGIRLKLDASQKGFRGLSHYEWGTLSPAQAFLVETPNPGQYPEDGQVDQLAHAVYPLWKRVAVQIETVRAILAVYAAGPDGDSAHNGDFLLDGLPDYGEIEREGLGNFF